MIKLRKISEEKIALTEKPLTRLHNVLLGLDPKVFSFGIISVENPMGEKSSPAENNKRTDEFKSIMKSGVFSYIKIKGQYGSSENSFIILNMNLDSLLHYGKMFEQKAVIFARNKFDYVEYYYYERDKENQPFKLRDQVDYYQDSNVDDFYSKLKNWKFKIPFPKFDEKIEIIRPYENKGNFPLSEFQINKINSINEEIVNSTNKTGKHLYMLRGRIRRILGCGMSLDQFDGNKWSDYPYIPYLERKPGVKCRWHE